MLSGGKYSGLASSAEGCGKKMLFLFHLITGIIYLEMGVCISFLASYMLDHRNG
jgi:hypothetical protein